MTAQHKQPMAAEERERKKTTREEEENDEREEERRRRKRTDHVSQAQHSHRRDSAARKGARRGRAWCRQLTSAAVGHLDHGRNRKKGEGE